MEVGQVLKKSWNVFRKNWVAMVLATIVMSLGSLLIITAPPLLFGLYVMAADAANGKKVETLNVLRGFNYFLKSWAYILLTGLLLFVGFVALVIPGIILYIMVVYAVPLIILQKKHGVMDGIKKSLSVAKKNFGFTASLVIILTVIGIIANGFPLLFLFTMPYIAICYTIAAKRLAKIK